MYRFVSDLIDIILQDKGNKRYAFYLFLKKKFQREGSVPPD